MKGLEILTMNIHHIGYAVEDIKEAVTSFHKLGYSTEGEIVKDIQRKIYVQFMKNQEIRIELISPIENENSPVDNILNNIGCMPYHICYEVNDINETIKTLSKHKFKLIQKPKEAMVIQNKLVAFLYHKNVGIVEIIEKEK